MTTLHHTPEQLKAMLDAATGGEWEADAYPPSDVDSYDVQFVTIGESCKLCFPDRYTGHEMCQDVDDAKLIAASRTIAEDAIALHEQLRWRSINSAPQDGTEFQGWFVNDNGIGFWEPRCRFNEDGLLQAWGRVDYDIDGWDNTFDLTFSGWMPLPSPPPQENE